MTLAEITEREGIDYRVNLDTGCWDWIRPKNKPGYPLGYAHRRYWEALNGPRPDDHHVHHECRNRGCVNPAHLKAIPAEEHWAQHALEKRVLTVDEGRRMRALAADPALTYDEIGAEFGVSRQYVYEVAFGRRFTEISDQPVELPARVCASRRCSNEVEGRRRQAIYCCTRCRIDENRWKILDRAKAA